MISPDTLQDEVKRDVYYYRVYIRTDSNHLTNRQGKAFPVFPGMIATVDIKTGSKSVIDYLLKPLNKAKRRCASGKRRSANRTPVRSECRRHVDSMASFFGTTLM